MKLPIRSFGSPTIIPRLQPTIAYRTYATHHSQPTNSAASAASKRRAVTPFNDNGFVPWSELSVGEKASRATQQTFNFGLVVVGLVLTGGVGYFLYTDVFSPDSKTAYFNRAVDRIKKDPECVRLLGDSKKIIAHGEETMNKWRRARPISSTQYKDEQGNQHLIMHFYVEGPLNNGVVNAHLIKYANRDDFEYKYFCIDITGHSRIYLENADSKPAGEGKRNFKLFGVNWK
ncbi:mitochondrial import inner membrane translocase subunit TIM21 [Daldinia vernicosa]|uniref:mitochondrial import inner membrane translocase subunit TIM21 n=1 Tax=Daldinia vernicosa TaxID=114800 RepID=UPI002008DF0A|nr:mitochondrial import inner membrane translocase subunit TIM21 [Daldinia vernicosa]KAI0852581.1 mitochondrial import inner membrane translocase subunit TIM21 [Daldinia vernicosa]